MKLHVTYGDTKVFVEDADVVEFKQEEDGQLALKAYDIPSQEFELDDVEVVEFE